ncbi:MAG: TPM domain-containing protein [Smithellaceae bacterium]|nr:TPM domain-containing protein [Smithellaceae bacterium]
MKKHFYSPCGEYLKFLLLCVAVVIVLTQGTALAAETYPPHRGTAVNDFASVIDGTNAAKMESLAREILQKTGMSVVVATVPELGPTEEINLYANGLYQAWGIGKKGEDKGVLIFLAVKERQIRIETGYGVEGDLTDGIVGLILDRYVVAHLKAGNTGKALYNAMYSCGVVVAEKAGMTLTGVDVPYRSPSQPGNQGLNVFTLIFIVVAAILMLGTRTGRQMLPWILLMLISNSGRGGGGGFGGGFGGFGGGMSGGGGAGRSF